MARRRFQRGSVFQNATKTTWFGMFSEYYLDSEGVEQRRQKKITLCPFRKPDGSTTTTREARRLLQPYIDKQNARIGSPSQEIKTKTFAAFADTWRDDYLAVAKPSTQSSVRSVLKRLKDHFGDKAMELINAGDVQRLVVRLTAAGMNPKSIRNHWGVIRLIWNVAQTQGYVSTVLPKPTLPKRTRGAKKFFTLDEVARILFTGEPLVFYWLLAETGIRAGEHAGLKLTDINGSCLHIRQSIWNGDEQALKTTNSERVIAMSPYLKSLVEAQVKAQRERKHEWLFSTEPGSPIDMNNWRQRKLTPLLEELGIPTGRSFHAFRHFNQSMMDALGVPLKTREERGGHSLTNSITQIVYTHSLEGSANAEAAQKLADALTVAVDSVTESLPELKELPACQPEALEKSA